MSSAGKGQWIAVGVIVAVLAGALTMGVLIQGDIQRVEVGAQAPGFTATDLASGEIVSLADYQGEVVLLNLWATWCAPCRVEMPSMQRLYEALASEGLKIVAVSVDAGNPDAVKEFSQELSLTFDILHDETMEIETTYQTTGLPESFIIDRSGAIVHWEIGPEQWDSQANINRIRLLLADD